MRDAVFNVLKRSGGGRKRNLLSQGRVTSSQGKSRENDIANSLSGNALVPAAKLTALFPWWGSAQFLLLWANRLGLTPLRCVASRRSNRSLLCVNCEVGNFVREGREISDFGRWAMLTERQRWTTTMDTTSSEAAGTVDLAASSAHPRPSNRDWPSSRDCRPARWRPSTKLQLALRLGRRRLS